MKYHAQHTHINPKGGRGDEPLLLVVDGPRDGCEECKKKKPKPKPKKTLKEEIDYVATCHAQNGVHPDLKKGSGLDVLCINTYAGSLLLGAAGYKIRGSYEDSGFGTPIQRANFPRVDCREKTEQWPAHFLKDTVVLAHPPCSAFSNQNHTPGARGLEAEAFKCTTQVLSYSMKLKAAAIAVESVTGAMEGARQVHDHYAKEHGYYLYRYLQNAVTYGLPQWRKRFWAIFVRKDLLPAGKFTIAHNPKFKSLGELMDEGEPGRPLAELEHPWHESEKRLREYLDSNAAKALMAGRLGYGPLPLVTEAHTGEGPAGKFHWNERDRVFRSRWLKILDPDGYAPVLLADSWFACRGKTLAEGEYKAIMGFPRDYVFPEGPLRRNLRMYLSKGVCPPVAAHVLGTIDKNLNGKEVEGKFWNELKDGETADFRIKEKEWKQL